ncbi:hypothetical protein B0I08_102342 [Glaciihabitans tibetensis]|uniref:Alpha/beta hydrolase family protein n=2 Tax=Glaciihabitans tibetensis TaxID=1266600 RepID=A0A2T0VHL0_9MICO|nr:hypothetical protein B0I08_102342 [Glaciihabitans tibetensis]
MSSPLLHRRAARGVRRTSADFGALWRGTDTTGQPLIVICSSRPAAMSWLASSLAAGLPALVAVVRLTDSGAEADATSATESVGAFDRAVTEAARAATALGADPARLGIVGEGAAASVALTLAAARAKPDADDSDESDDSDGRGDNDPNDEFGRHPVMRLALISPGSSSWGSAAGSAAVIPPFFPPTLIQFARGGSAAQTSTALEQRLSAAGVAVRGTDYQAPRDGWATRSRAVKQSTRGANDLVAFFARGFGAASTFHVIPGWDLH